MNYHSLCRETYHRRWKPNITAKGWMRGDFTDRFYSDHIGASGIRKTRIPSVFLSCLVKAAVSYAITGVMICQHILCWWFAYLLETTGMNHWTNLVEEILMLLTVDCWWMRLAEYKNDTRTHARQEQGEAQQHPMILIVSANFIWLDFGVPADVIGCYMPRCHRQRHSTYVSGDSWALSDKTEFLICRLIIF